MTTADIRERQRILRAYDAERQRKSRAKRGPHVRAFAFVDGEGGDIGGEHRYLLLRAGTHVVMSHDGETELSPQEILEFLVRLPRDVTYLSYFFDYDVTMILRRLPEERLRRLMNRDSRPIGKNKQPLPVDFGPYQIDYLPHKYFRVRRSGGPWLEVSDVSSFFQCSFLRAITDWEIGTPELREKIRQGKESRVGFGKLTPQTVRYNRMECELGVELMDKFRETCREVGYLPSKWQGPGYLAVSMFRAHGIPKTKELTFPREVLELANSAYYGGRFETTLVGRFDRPVYQYDINSAYPYAISTLPCLEHGEWTHDDTGDFVLRDVHFEPRLDSEDTFLYGLPVRGEDGGIYFPAEGNGVYWDFELRAAKHQRYEVKDSWSYRQTCTHQPFEFVTDVYRQRLEMGKQARGKVLKLALNSLYGKTAQSIGGAPYANPIYASLITARTRVQLASAVHSDTNCTLGYCGNNVLMLATDAVFSTEKLNLPVSPFLGAWDLEVHPHGMFSIQPGIYWTTDPGKPKTRGIPQSKVIEHAEDFERMFSRMYGHLYDHGADESFEFDDFRVTMYLRTFISLRQSLARNDLPSAGTWPDVEKRVSYDWRSKRAGYFLQNQHVRTLPLKGGPDVHSIPYAKDIGNWTEVFRFDSLDQPDFGSDTFTGEV